eukprot:2352582-Prymnesium_polylepis.1
MLSVATEAGSAEATGASVAATEAAAAPVAAAAAASDAWRRRADRSTRISPQQNIRGVNTLRGV